MYITESVTRVPEVEDAYEVAALWSYAIEDEIGKSESQQVVLLRDIFGNPFRPIAFSPEWRTDTSVTLARTMYESRREFSLDADFGRCPSGCWVRERGGLVALPWAGATCERVLRGGFGTRNGVASGLDFPVLCRPA